MENSVDTIHESLSKFQCEKSQENKEYITMVLTGVTFDRLEFDS